MDREEAVVESGGGDVRQLPPCGERILRSTTRRKNSIQQERKEAPVNDGAVARIAKGTSSAQVEPQRTLRRSARHHPQPQPSIVTRSNTTPTRRSARLGSQLHRLQVQEQVVQQEQGSDQHQLTEESSLEQSLPEENHGKETEERSEDREQSTKRDCKEGESEDLQVETPADHNQTAGTDQLPDPAANCDSLAEQGLNVSNGDCELKEELVQNSQRPSEKQNPLASESCPTVEEPISNRSPIASEDQYENNTKKIINADNSPKLQQDTSSLQVDMLPTDPEASKASESISNTRTQGNQFSNNDDFASPPPPPPPTLPSSQGTFPIKFPCPSQMEMACTDNKDDLSGSAFLRTKHPRTRYSQGHSFTELAYAHGKCMDSRTQPVFTDNNVQKERSKKNPSVPPATISDESCSGKRDFFSGSEQKYPVCLESNYPDANSISTGHNPAITKAACLSDTPLPHNAIPGPTSTKQVRKSVKQAAPREPLNKTGVISKMDFSNTSVFDYKTKPGFSNQSSILNKGYQSPFPTPRPTGKIRTAHMSTSLSSLHSNMSLPSPICSFLGEGLSSGQSSMKHDVNAYPIDAHSAPPLDTCSNQSQSMRPPSSPISTQPGIKSSFCSEECPKRGSVSKTYSNIKSRLYLDKPHESCARSNFDSSIISSLAGIQKPIQTAFMSAQNIPCNNNNHLLQKSLCMQSKAASISSTSSSLASPQPLQSVISSASSTLVSPPYNPSLSTIKNEPSPSIPSSTNITKTTCSGASSLCLHHQQTNFMHPKNARYTHKAPPLYQTSSIVNAPNTTSHNNLSYTKSVPSSYNYNNNAAINKHSLSSGISTNTKAGRTVCRTSSEEPLNLRYQGYHSTSSSTECKLTHICSATNLVTPLYTSSIYTCSSNTSTFSSSTQSSQSPLHVDSASKRHSKFKTFPPPPSYSEVINAHKNHDLQATQNIGSCKKLLWQPFSDEKPKVHIKTEVITGTYPGEMPTSSQTLTSSSSTAFGQSTFTDSHLVSSQKGQIASHKSSASSGPLLHQACQTTFNTHPTHHPVRKTKANLKPRLGENGTSILSGYKQRKMPHKNIPPSHGDNKQVPSWMPKMEQNPIDSKNEIKCTFKIKNSEFNAAHFQNTFLNSCPKFTNIPSDKMNRISNALNETTKRIFNNNHPAGGPTPMPHCADGRKTPDRKPHIKTEPGLNQYENSSKTEAESENDDLIRRLKTNRKTEIPMCGCLGPGYVPNEAIEGPYYTQLGTGSSMEDIKSMMEERTGLTGKAVRIESIIYSGKEGKSSQGCPIAKWIIRRAGVEEKILCLVRRRRGHFCPTACIVICVVAWEGVPKSVADDMYSYLVPTLREFGFETDRRCGYNEQKTCACQGVDMKKRGASFSFGCSWSMYFNGCKFARSREAKKFRLKDTTMDEVVESKFQNLATRLAPLYKSIAPESYQNQVFFEDNGYECRLGHRTENDEKPCRPFSGVTACVDFCAHAHKDLHNMNNGCTVVVTLTKHGPLERPDEEQLHVLPLYILDLKDNVLEEKKKNGSIDVLTNYPKVARIRAIPVTPKRKGKNSKKNNSSNKKENTLKSLNTKVSSHAQPQGAKNSTPAFSDKFLKAATNISGFNKKNNLVNKANLFQGEKNMQLASSKGEVVTTASGVSLSSGGRALKDQLLESEKQPPLPANANMYDEFWKYFYSYGTFPPANFLNDGKSADSMKLITSHLPEGKAMFASPTDKSTASLAQHSAGDPKKDGLASVLARPGSACSIPLCSSGMKDVKSPYSVSNLTLDDFESPLHLLSEAVMIRSQTSIEKPRPAASHQQAGTSVSTLRKPAPNSELSSSMRVTAGKSGVGLVAGGNLHPQLGNQAFPSTKVPVEFSQDQHSRFSSVSSQFDPKNIFDTNGSCQAKTASQTSPSTKQSSLQSLFIPETQSRTNCPDGCTCNPTPEVISSELEYNEQNFSDPDIGGVAIALTHGSVLFEVAKRELHATTALLNPNRYKPTRISLVFYQHKSMNLRYHGWYENERKLELQRQKRLQKMQEEAEKGQPIADSELKPGNRKKRKKEEAPVVGFVAKYKHMWPACIKHTITQTTDTIITQWIDPQSAVTGPYQKWI